MRKSSLLNYIRGEKGWRIVRTGPKKGGGENRDISRENGAGAGRNLGEER